MKTSNLFFTFFLTSLSLLAQPAAEPLTVERIFNSGEFRSESFGNVRWLEDASGYTTLERSAENPGFTDLVKYSAGSMQKSILVKASEMIPQGKERPVRIENYSWSPDNSKLLIFTNGRRVWRYNTRGDYWVLDLQTRKLEQVGKSMPASSLMFAKFSPDGTQIAYVSNNNIYTEELSSGKIIPLTRDGSQTIINGTTDWVYEEEFHLRDAFSWSPDGKKIAYLQFDASGIGVYHMINTTDSIYPRIIPVQYPKVGTTNSACLLGVVLTTTGETRWMQVPGDERNNYIARLGWAANSEEVMIQRLNRQQNRNEVMFCNAYTTEVHTVFTDLNQAWLDVCDDVIWLGKDREFTWLSERDGWAQLLRIQRDGKKVHPITPPGMDVISVLKIDEKSGWVYFIASPENPTQRYLYRTDIRGRQKPRRLSPENLPGTHSYNISADGAYAFHTYSNFSTPPVTSLISLPDHKIIRTFTDNRNLKEKLEGLQLSAAEFFRVRTPEVELDGYMIRPPDFDPSKKYPVLFHVYGEPASQTVLDRFGGQRMLFHQMLAQQGYVVMSVDNRGTPSPRGADFRKSIYGQIGIINARDQAQATKALLEQHAWMDPDRLGVWGWSGGGSMTLNLLFQYPEIYKAGVSIAPVGAQWFYDTIYQERYMGLIEDNREGYVQGSPLTHAANLEGKLLLIHGTGDDNVHYQNAEVVINELIRHNKQFSMFAYPNRSHGISEGPGTTLHLYNMISSFIKENL